MKGNKKCFGLFVALFIMLGLSLSVYSNESNALQHQYVGITYYTTAIPNTVYNSTTGDYDVGTYDHDGIGGYIGGGNFQLEWQGDAYQSEYDNLSMKKDTATLDLVWDSNKNKCAYGNSRGIYNTLPWTNPYDGSSFNGINAQYGSIPRYFDDWIIDKNSLYGCQTLNKFGENGKPQFDEQSTPTGPLAVLSCDKSNGLTCGHIEFVGNIVHNDILPYYYSADGFYLKNKAVDSGGVTYGNTFSFYDMFNGGKASKAYIPTFSKLVIPFSADYFLDSQNLYSGREIEFSGAFEFDSSFSWHDNINNNGSFWRINGMGLSKDTGQWDYFNFDCITNEIVVSGSRQLTYSCPYTLTQDYLVADFNMEINGNGNYVWITDDEWRFYYNYYTTDNDSTPGSYFNDNITGNSKNIIGSAEDNIPEDGGLSSFFNSLTNLFSFNFTNPFAPLFNLFTSGENCASIPIIAGMLHTDQTTYCSWFPSSVKNVLTPVFGLSSVMLVFGFAVHWLGSSSGNMFEDSGTHEWGKLRFGKGGKK